MYISYMREPVHCPFCFHRHSIHIGELYCSNTAPAINRDRNDHCIKLLNAAHLVQTEWHQTRLSIRYILNGTEQFYTPEKQMVLRTGSFLILNNSQHYKSAIESDTTASALTVAFKKGFAEEVYNSLVSSHQSLLDNPFYNRHSALSFYETTYSDAGVTTALESCIRSLQQHRSAAVMGDHPDFYSDLLEKVFLHTHQAYKNIEQIKNAKPGTRLEVYRRLCIAYEMIQALYDTPLTLEVLALTSNLSLAYLKRAFKEYYGVTPHALIVRKRLEAAQHLLASTPFTVQAIAHSVGFENTSSFIRLFRRHSHCTPALYRQLHKK